MTVSEHSAVAESADSESAVSESAVSESTAATALPDAADVVVVGAGLAGLSAAIELVGAGLSVLVLEAADAPGGRVRTDLVDGFRLDRGFQLVNPAYPRIRRLVRLGVLDPDRLQLCPFDAGVRVVYPDRAVVIADPRRRPKESFELLRAPGGVRAKAALAAWALWCGYAPVSSLLEIEDRPYGQLLDRWQIGGALRTDVLEPFLAGVLGEDTTASSARVVQLLVRAFVRGTPSVPAWGMQAIPDQLAAALPVGTLRLGVRVEQLDATTVRTSHGTVSARAVLVATDPGSAAALTGLPAPSTNALTTFWFAADEPPFPRPILHVDGSRRGPIVNAGVLSTVSPAYSPDGRALIAASIVGARPDLAADVRRHAGAMFGPAAADWELLRVDAIPDALPAMAPPRAIRDSVRLDSGVFVAGDHRDTASQQGALASGGRAAGLIRATLT